MKHIVMFSGGAASAYLAKLVVDERGADNTVLLHTPVYAEHPDADRFRKEVSEFIGVEITEQADGRSLWELIADYNALPSHFMPFCTQQLKILDRCAYEGIDIDEAIRLKMAYNKTRPHRHGRKRI